FLEIAPPRCRQISLVEPGAAGRCQVSERSFATTTLELSKIVLWLGAVRPGANDIDPVAALGADDLRHATQKIPASQNFQVPPLSAYSSATRLSPACASTAVNRSPVHDDLQCPRFRHLLARGTIDGGLRHRTALAFPPLPVRPPDHR